MSPFIQMHMHIYYTNHLKIRNELITTKIGYKGSQYLVGHYLKHHIDRLGNPIRTTESKAKFQNLCAPNSYHITYHISFTYTQITSTFPPKPKSHIQVLHLNTG